MADQTESQIVIRAPQAAIMDVIADLDSYPSWSEGITSVEVLSVFDDEDERPAEATFHLESGPIKDTYTLEYDWSGDDEVSWKLVKGQMLNHMDGTYTLDDNGDGTTTVHYRLAVGVNIPMIGLIRRKAEKVIVDTALKGLKKRVETG